MSKTYYLVDLNAVVVSADAINTINNLDTKERKTFLKKLIDNDHLEIVNFDKADDDDFVERNKVNMIDNYLEIMWSLYKNTDKGWQIEETYNSKKEAEYYLEEWQEEFPNCKFKIEENV
tara:strand:- start:85 stop:441 length:357 start_codon:yes stop_codon:yes gene_type:complete